MATTTGSDKAKGGASELDPINEYLKGAGIVVTNCFTYEISQKMLGVEDYKNLRENIPTSVCPNFENVRVLPKISVEHFIILLHGSEGIVYLLFGVWDMYLKAYCREGGNWWALDHGYKSTHFKHLAFNESYVDAKGICRMFDKKLSEVIPSRMNLDMAVTYLSTINPPTKGKGSHEINKCIANSLLLCTAMLSEGLRFHAIVDFCTRNDDDNVNPKQLGTYLMGLVHNWGQISKYLLNYNKGQECLINEKKVQLADLAKYVSVIKDVIE